MGLKKPQPKSTQVRDAPNACEASKEKPSSIAREEQNEKKTGRRGKSGRRERALDQKWGQKKAETERQRGVHKKERASEISERQRLSKASSVVFGLPPTRTARADVRREAGQLAAPVCVCWQGGGGVVLCVCCAQD